MKVMSSCALDYSHQQLTSGHTCQMKIQRRSVHCARI